MTAPIGERESETLELKAKDALVSGVKIARAVVAFLNAGGGTVWVGIVERDGRAESATPIEDLEAAFERLQNQLIDTIEPAPTIPEEVAIERVPCPGRADGEILRLRVKTGSRRPYAQLEQRGRQYWLRAGSRNRVMSHGELGDAFRAATRNVDAEDARVVKERQEAEHSGAQFWMSVRPRPAITVDVQSPEVKELLTDASKTGNRPTGFTYVARGLPKTGGSSVTVGSKDYQETRLSRDGRIEFRATFERLNWGGAPEEISPFVLIELPLSVLRLARRVLELSPGAQDVVVDLALFNARDRKLRRGSPSEFTPHEPPVQFAYDSLVFDRPFVFSAQDVRESPEKCNLRLVERLYEEFDLTRQDFPRELDPRTGAFLLGV